MTENRKKCKLVKTDGITAKKPHVYKKALEKRAAFGMLIENGVDKLKAAEVLGYKEKTAYSLQKKIENKGKIDLTGQIYVIPAVRNLRKLIRGKTFGDLKGVKDSTVLSAIEVVLDRSHPKKAEVEAPSMIFTQVNLLAYRTPGSLKFERAGEDLVPMIPPVEVDER